MGRCGLALLYPYPGVTSAKPLWMKFGKIQRFFVSYARKKAALKVGVANVSRELYVAVAEGGLMLITETILPKIPFASFANLRM